MNLVSGKRRADDRRLICVRQSRVVLAPVAGVKFAEARRLDRAWTNLNPLMTVTRRIRSPGRARNKPLKPLRAGMPGDLGCTCGDYARVLPSPFAREATGATRTRHSPRPLFSGRMVQAKLGRIVSRECEVVFCCLKIESVQFIAVRTRHTMRRPRARGDP